MMTLLTSDQIKNLTCPELRTELKTRGLPANGKRIELKARLQEYVLEQLENNTSGETKRRTSSQFKASIYSSLQEFLCPISRELPIEPVSDSNGQIYERSEIKRYIELKKDAGEDLISPATRQKMDDILFPAPHVYSAIEGLLKENKINTDLAKSWLERVKQREDDKKELAEMLAKAEAGETVSMYNIGWWYRSGQKGRPKDIVKAVQWYKKCSDLHDPRGMASYGNCLITGLGGVAKSAGNGLLLMGRAASEGSNLACYYLGNWYRYGKHGLAEDKKQAKFYLEKVFDGSCNYKHLSPACIDEAKKLLADIEIEIAATGSTRLEDDDGNL